MKKYMLFIMIILMVSCASYYTMEDWDKLPDRKFTFGKVVFWPSTIGFAYETDDEVFEKGIRVLPIEEIAKTFSKRFNITVDTSEIDESRNSQKKILKKSTILTSTTYAWEQKGRSRNYIGIEIRFHPQAFGSYSSSQIGWSPCEISSCSFSYGISIYANNSKIDYFTMQSTGNGIWGENGKKIRNAIRYFGFMEGPVVVGSANRYGEFKVANDVERRRDIETFILNNVMKGYLSDWVKSQEIWDENSERLRVVPGFW